MKTTKIIFCLVLTALVLLTIAGCSDAFRKNNKDATIETMETSEPLTRIIEQSSEVETAKNFTTEIELTSIKAVTTEKVLTTVKTATTVNDTTSEKASIITTIATTKSSGVGDYTYAGLNPAFAVIDEDNWNLLLVNRHLMLPSDFLVDLAYVVNGYQARLDSRVSPHYISMYNAAKADGLTLVPISGHRRISTQKTNFENKINEYIGQGYSKVTATQKAAQIILPPGCSEHNAGLAMDICSLDTNFENTKEFKWLMKNAEDYGFIMRYPKDKKAITEITYEPWHWRYVGVETAKAMNAGGQCLEEYLQ